MGACGCAGGSGRLPSAVQLCDALESTLSASQQQSSRIQAQDVNQNSSVHMEASSIWHYVEKDEVRALGLIVERWSKGKLDGRTARQQFQSQVLRGQSQQAVELQNASSAFLRAGLDGALAGMNTGALVASPTATVATGTPAQAPQLSQGGSAFSAGGSSGSSSSGMNGTLPSGPFVSVGNSPSHGFFAGALFGGLTAAVLGGARAGARTETVFSAIDTIFLTSTFEESFGMAMQRLGLDGPRALPSEVRVSFEQRARAVLEAAPRQQAGSSSSWLDLVMLCLWVEVIRNLKGPFSGGSSSVEYISPGTQRSGDSSPGMQRSGSASSSSQPPPQGGSAQSPIFASSLDQPGHLPVLFGLDWPQQENGARAGDAGIAEGDDPASFRLDPDFLRDRVFVLLESLLGGVLVASARPPGLSSDEMDLHCPVGSRLSANNDSCPICLEPCVIGEPVRCLPCKHELHKECCEAWLATADTCPTCRHQVPRA